MGSLGLPEIIFIMVIALLIFGPKRLPEIGRTLGKGMAEFRKATNDLKNTISTELSIEEEQPARPRRVDMASVVPSLAPPAPRPLPAETVAQDAQDTRGVQDLQGAPVGETAAFSPDPAVVPEAVAPPLPAGPIEPS